MLSYLWVFIGGGLGSMARFGMTELTRTSLNGFPIATFLANMMSCFILGYLIGSNLKSEWSSQSKLLLMTGFCGGFSTFSTFSAENYQLLQDGQYATAATYILISVLLGLGFVSIGILISSK